MSKPWIELSADSIAAIPAQLGVFQIGDGDGTILRIGYAGGREAFGLRSALGDALAEDPDGDRTFRVELTHSYLTRWEELLMVHQAVHGSLPVGNANHLHPLGTLTVDGSSD